MSEAAAVFLEGLELYPRNALLNNNYGVVLMRQGKLEEAMARFELALVKDPANEDARRNKDDLEKYMETRAARNDQRRHAAGRSRPQSRGASNQSVPSKPFPPAVRLRRPQKDEELV